MTRLVALLPSPSTGVLHLEPLPLRAYAMCIVLAIVAAVWLTSRRSAAGRPRQPLPRAAPE